MPYLRKVPGRRSLQGVYSQLNYPLPSNSLPTQALMPAAVSAIKAAANLVVNGSGRAGMSGAYLRKRAWQPPVPEGGPSRLILRGAGMGVVSSPGETAGAFDWIKNNPGMAAGIAIGAVMLLGMGGKRSRR